VHDFVNKCKFRISNQQVIGRKWFGEEVTWLGCRLYVGTSKYLDLCIDGSWVVRGHLALKSVE